MTDMFLKKFLYTRILQLQLVETLHQIEQSRDPVKQKRFEFPPIVPRQRSSSRTGGGFAAVPAYLKDIFGTRYVGAIHGLFLTAWSTAGI
jgi:hypothetical protein